MTEKRFTTVELPKPNRWGIWYDGAYLSTYQVCTLLNEYVDVRKENEELKQKNGNLVNMIARVQYRADSIKEENEQLKQQLFEARKDYLIETADISDKLYLDEMIEEERREIFE